MLSQIVINEAAGDPPMLVQLAPYLGIVGAAVALLGVWLGKRIERRDTNAAWLRNQRLDGLEAFISAAMAHWAELDRIIQLPSGRRAAERASSRETRRPFMASVARLLAVLPEDAADSVGEITLVFQDLHELIWGGREPGSPPLDPVPDGQGIVGTSYANRFNEAYVDLLWQIRELLRAAT